MSAILNVNNYCLTGRAGFCASTPPATLIAKGPEGGPFGAATINGLGANAPVAVFSRPIQVTSFDLAHIAGGGGPVAYAPVELTAPLPLPLPAIVSGLRLNILGLTDEGGTYRLTINWTDACDGPQTAFWDFTTDST